MIYQCAYLEGWDWLVRVFYETVPEDCDDVTFVLEQVGADEETVDEARRNILKGDLNTGLTYTNPSKGMSVVVMSKTTDASEFQDTFDHEKGHLVKHIAKAYGIDPFGEECEYLAGAVGKALFKVARTLLCDGCRTRAGV